jgi:ribosomal protein S17E
MDRFRDGTRQNARRIDEAEWEKHKDRILELYETNRLKVKEVKEVMEREHGFIAS